MPKLRDLTGMTFGKLKAIKTVPRTGRATKWLCECSCGRETIVAMGNLCNGHTKSCGYCHEIINHGDYMTYVCKNGRSFQFDTEDLPTVQARRWTVDNKGYVSSELNGRHVKLHRLLMNDPKGKVVDHINNNPSDCRKSNLRVTSQHCNAMNCSLPKNSTTGYKGVCFDKKEGKYMAHIHPSGRMVFLGYFDTPERAAVEYDRAAVKYFGEYARLNFA